MREIKFRGKRRDNGEWVYGSLVNMNETYSIMSHDFMNHPGWQRFNVAPETVGQYTGLKDKNGVEIYEGGVVEYDYYYFEGLNNGATGFSEWQRHGGEVCFIDGCFTVGEQIITQLGDANEDTDYPFEPDYEKGLKVIGNIYENPELLEKKGGMDESR